MALLWALAFPQDLEVGGLAPVWVVAAGQHTIGSSAKVDTLAVQPVQTTSLGSAA